MHVEKRESHPSDISSGRAVLIRVLIPPIGVSVPPAWQLGGTRHNGASAIGVADPTVREGSILGDRGDESIRYTLRSDAVATGDERDRRRRIVVGKSRRSQCFRNRRLRRTGLVAYHEHRSVSRRGLVDGPPERLAIAPGRGVLRRRGGERGPSASSGQKHSPKRPAGDLSLARARNLPCGKRRIRGDE